MIKGTDALTALAEPSIRSPGQGLQALRQRLAGQRSVSLGSLGQNPWSAGQSSFANRGNGSTDAGQALSQAMQKLDPEMQKQLMNFLQGLPPQAQEALKKLTGGQASDLLQALIEHIKNGGKLPGQNQQQQGQQSAGMPNLGGMPNMGGASNGGASNSGPSSAARSMGDGRANTGKSGPIARSKDLNHVPENSRKLLQAVAKQESGGNYHGPTNKDARHADGRKIGAIGKYQMLGENVANWSKQAAAKGLIPQEVAARLNKDPEAIAKDPSLHKYQDIVAASKMEDYRKEALAKGHSPDDAVRYVASAWYSGSGSKMNSQKPQKGYPSIQAYTHSVLAKYKAIV